ncbi:MAG: valine--tRNA ligase [Elusimicrobiaceae bacterium]|nr:valine--tRNA ligase [Elusimicrobiaceae bacterium]
MLPKTYEPQPVEEKLAALWQKDRLFVSHIPQDSSKKSFVIVIPPPNITGALHMGHALNDTLQDALVRANRMFGSEAFWVPGTDHGGIATQTVMEKKISRERKLKRTDLGREKFIEQLWCWYEECGGTILGQLNKLGCALDLGKDNVRFTMDGTRGRAVFESFRRLWEKKYIYRGERMINWCVRCGTALSDIEVEHEQQNSKLWHIRYPFAEGDGEIIVATTRPETMLGDTAVAVNPGDERYAALIGKKLRLPLTGRLIPVVGDDEVDMQFGTGAVKVTPAHDPVDFEIGKRHNLEVIKVIDYDGCMIGCCAPYLGLERGKCRHRIIADLTEAGFFVQEEHHGHGVGTCYRCHQPIEPMVSEQWFVHMKELAEPAIRAAVSDRVQIHPAAWKKPFVDWLRNIEDWCISRQIWWGHRIPVWYCKTCSHGGLVYNAAGELSRVSFAHGAQPIVSYDRPEKCPCCGGQDLLQDPDVLDTWFSSALWPFSVFGWPEKTPELDFYYPTSVLVTGYEIIYLWVARMLMMGLEFMGDVPFKDVYIHGIVRDKHGKKMSKSIGNVVDPLDLIAKYGTDAVRFSLLAQAFPGKDIPFGEESITGARNFCNKIYNAQRFVMMHLPETPRELKLPGKFSSLSDRWIVDRYMTAVRDARADIENFDLASAAVDLYHFLWGAYCDWYVELAKPRLQNESEKEEALAVLVYVLYGTLKALHPFMPYITEELAAALRPYTDSKARYLLEERYPAVRQDWFDETAATEMELIMGATTSLRTVRSHFNVPPGLKLRVIMSAKTSGTLLTVRQNADYIALLARLDGFDIGLDVEKPRQSATAVFKDLSIYIPLEGIIDMGKERERLVKEMEKLETEVELCRTRLENENFVKKAPADQVASMRLRLAEAEHKAGQVKTAMADLAG